MRKLYPRRYRSSSSIATIIVDDATKYVSAHQWSFSGSLREPCDRNGAALLNALVRACPVVAHNYPGQTWLWLYTMLYQVPPFTTTAAANADVLIWLIMGVLTLLLIIFPFIPYLNRLPYRLGVHRLIWREYYRDVKSTEAKAPTPPSSAEQAQGTTK